MIFWGSADSDPATNTVNGRRDLAILLLSVRLGVRRGEVSRLRLADIDWRAGEPLVRGNGPRVERLRLPADVGESLAGYLRDGRPTDAGTRVVFMRVRAPRAAMTPPGITQAVVSASKRAGLGEVTPHALRHTAASELLRRGAPACGCRPAVASSHRADLHDLSQGRLGSPPRVGAAVAGGAS